MSVSESTQEACKLLPHGPVPPDVALICPLATMLLMVSAGLGTARRKL
jgi:hypothetical protein